MLKNYCKTTVRYLLRHKGYTTVNILGLAIGMACCILIMLFIRSEISYDKFHTKADRIYRAWLHEKYDGQEFVNTQTPIPLGPALQVNIPEVESNCRVYAFSTHVQFDGNKFNESVVMADSNFFQLFDFNLLEGDRKKKVLLNTNSLVVSRELAKKYFGNDRAIGKNLELQLGGEKVLFTVAAISEKTPPESSIKFDILIPHSNDHYLFSEAARTCAWTNVFEETYVLVKEGKMGTDVEQKVPELVKKISGDNYKEGQYNVHLQPITDIHLNKSLPAGNLPISDPAYVYILGSIGFLILLIACINFVTLSVGRSAARATEVGVRKVLGAERQQLIRQFWGEALLVTFISFCLALGLSFLLLKPFNIIANKELFIAFDGFAMLFFVGVIAIVGLVAGIYLAIILSAMVAIEALKGRLNTGNNIGFFRNVLIAGQFTSSILMIIGTIIISQQLSFLRNKNLGYNKEHIVIIPTNKNRTDGLPLAVRFKEILEKNPKVLSSTVSLFSFSEPGWAILGYEDDRKLYHNFRMNAIDAGFVKTLGLQIVKGRNFANEIPADNTLSMIVNESSKKFTNRIKS